MAYTNTTPSLPFASGSDTSRDAALRALKYVGPQGGAVLDFVRGFGSWGATQKEIAAALSLGRPSVCARVRALEQAGEIVKSDRRREGCAVYVRPWVTTRPELQQVG